MQSRWSVNLLICGLMCFGGSGLVAAQESAVGSQTDCGCGDSGQEIAEEGCLKGREISQADAEALWNGYCEGDCRIGHSHSHHRCGRGGCGQCGRGHAGFGFPGCGNGCNSSRAGGGCGCSSGTGTPCGSGTNNCGCGDRTPLIGSHHLGAGLGCGSGIFSRSAHCSCAATASDGSCANTDTSAATSSGCGCGNSTPRVRSCLIGGRANDGCDSNGSCEQSQCRRCGLLSGLGGCRCRKCGSSHQSQCDCDACRGSGRSGCGLFHGFSLGCLGGHQQCGCGQSNWDDMCGKEFFGSPAGATPSAK